MEQLAEMEYIDKNLKSAKIRPSKSSDGYTLFFDREKDDALRGVVYYRGLNIINKRNSTAISRTDEMFDRLGKVQYVPKIDLKRVFIES